MPPSPLVWLLIAGNAAWTAESFLLIATEGGRITALGTAFVAAQALAVMGVTLLEYAGLRKMRAAV
jgi:ferric-dicitrate binding protein FerR (iron transport regulator)